MVPPLLCLSIRRQVSDMGALPVKGQDSGGLFEQVTVYINLAE